MTLRLLTSSAAVAAVIGLAGYSTNASSGAPGHAGHGDHAAHAAVTATAAKGGAQAVGLPIAIVHKSPTCGCCKLWIDHLEEAGFRVQVRESYDLEPIKKKLGVPYGEGSCHTAEIGGYFVEGHVPAEDIKRMLARKPKARGLTVPAMPLGSPGMEVPSGEVEPYVVKLVATDGSTSVWARHGQ
jgi:hypothetical protein